MWLKNIYHSMKPIWLKLVKRNQFNASLTQRRWERDMDVIIKENGHIQIDQDCNFRRRLQLRALDDGYISIGRNSFINTNVCITSRQSIIIGESAKIANNVVIVDHDHDYKSNNTGYLAAEIIIGNRVWIGANSIILRGVTIGDGAVVGAEAVVREDIPANAVAVGNPARVVKQY